MASSSNNQQELELTAIQADAVQKALRHWAQSNLISTSLVSDLLGSVRIVEESHDFDWERFAKYSFRLAIICFTIAITSLIFNEAIPKFIKRVIRLVLSLPALVRVIATSALAVAVHKWGYEHSLTAPQQVYRTEAIHSLGALLFGLAAFELLIALDGDHQKNFHIFCCIQLLFATIYGISAVLVQSNFIWSCGMIVLGTAFGSWTDYASGTYYLGMSYPLRFVLFGAALITVSGFMRDYILITPLWSTTRTWGMLYSFIALWMLSLFGNDEIRGGKFGAAEGGLGKMALWSIVFLCAATTAIWHGLRYGDSTTKGFGLTFLGINLYTKFFEFCWSAWYKSAFFAILAISLAAMGRYAESVNIALNEWSSNL
ncbi:hypothetical protein ONZ43_g4614 [Nemania bipapillata]|uniref:Uncharacterized protein n=1 Tax=Nemania bipapillata TaxID=110536 RepID=A0ACC2IKN3_9PEZI|nr:hypothetical protein ONZ43_g4614 [Nemania bipapillata]